MDADRANRPRDARPPFGIAWVKKYLPHYIKSPPSRLHIDLADDLRDIQTQRGSRRNYIAPRGSAKTTWLSKAYPLYCALEGVEPLTVLLAEVGELSESYLQAVKDELETNPHIANAYPDTAGKGSIWQSRRIQLRNGCVIMARSAGGRILGTTARDRRPTLVIVDDGNERGDAYSPTKRRRKLDWFARDVLPVGEPGTNFVVAGTPIHREAIVCDLLRSGGWKTRSYRALNHFPTDEDLWRQWEQILFNLGDPDRADVARAFYDAHREAMDAGAELLWPERETLNLYSLMSYRADRGDAAFKSEYQDQPGTDGVAEFPPEWLDRTDIWFHDWPEGLSLKAMYLDPSKGVSAKANDYQAHCFGGVHNGVIYVEAELRRETVPEMIQRTIRLAREFGPISVLLEDNGTMGFLAPEVQHQIAETRSLIPWETITQTDPKLYRIRGLSGYLSRGQIRIRATTGGRLLVDQLRDVPNGEFDDGCDALSGLVRRLEQLSAGR